MTVLRSNSKKGSSKYGSNKYAYKINIKRNYKKNMNERISVMVDEDLIKKLRFKQAAMLKKKAKAVSFSDVINDTLKKGLH